jgi:protein O-mannosyl-transferase
MSRVNTIRLLLAVIIVAAFGRIVTHDFVDWDDGPLIYNNTNLTTHSLSGLLHHWDPANKENTNMFNPLVFTVWWTLAFAQVDSPDLLGTTLNPNIFHVASLAVHFLCACLVLEILRRFKLRDWAAAAGAAVFAVHPLQTESVAWATAMKDLLSAFFALLTILQYQIAVEAQGKQRTRRYWLMSVFFIAALLSKPSTVVLPAIVGVIGFVAYRRPWKELLHWTGWWYAVALAFVLISSRIQEVPIPVGGPLWLRPLVALDALAFYLWKLVLPIHLSFDYGRNPHSLLSDPGFHHALYWTWIIPIALAIVLWRAKAKMLTTGALVFVLGLLPVLGLFEFAFQYFTTAADRYVYLPMLGVALAIAWAVDRRGGIKTALAMVAVVCVLASLSFSQAAMWTDTQTLYETAPIPPVSLHKLAIGNYYDRMAAADLRLAEQAFAGGDSSNAATLRTQAMDEYDRAIKYYRDAIAIDPSNTHGFDHLAKDLVLLNRIPEAIEVVQQWMTVLPNKFIVGEQKPGTLQSMLGSLYLRNHQYGEAADMFRQSLQLRDDPDVRKLLDFALKMLQQTAPLATPTTGPLM